MLRPIGQLRVSTTQLSRQLFQQVHNGGTSDVVADQNHKLVKRQPAQAHSLSYLRLQKGFYNMFVPSGYTTTSQPGYTRFSWWRFAHHCTTSAVGVLATHSLFVAVGASAAAVPAAAALNWVLKDGLGQLGTLVASSRFGKRVDLDPRYWFVVSGIALDGALGAELISPLLPSALIVAAGSVASAAKGIAWLTAGASQAALLLSLSRDRGSNLGDIVSKAGAQSTAASLVGTALGIGLASVLGSHHTIMLLACAALAPLHIFMLMRAAASAPISELSGARLMGLAQQYVSGGTVQTPADPTPRPTVAVVFGDDILNVVSTAEQLRLLDYVYLREEYMLSERANSGEFSVLLREGVSARAVLQSALEVALYVRDRKKASNLEEAKKQVASFQKCLDTAGWSVKSVLLPDASYVRRLDTPDARSGHSVGKIS